MDRYRIVKLGVTVAATSLAGLELLVVSMDPADSPEAVVNGFRMTVGRKVPLNFILGNRTWLRSTLTLKDVSRASKAVEWTSSLNLWSLAPRYIVSGWKMTSYTAQVCPSLSMSLRGWDKE